MSLRRFQEGKRYWWSENRKKKSHRHQKAHVKAPKWEHVTQRNKPGGPL